ncbi:hypothetical protein GDO78_008890 [Eleutherodactylus coqui]|uniref:Uncharacterized protein n=1 Tax=Eleutherodactylus coqui TaxID=57060 RepID=A0A8J6KEK6_ELECQ|nr:hypothetical protein GDO78_008890 [Eleutherodactylus coqui]
MHKQVFASLPDPDSVYTTHVLEPGYWKHVLMTTATSVKPEGKTNWVHTGHCQRVTGGRRVIMYHYILCKINVMLILIIIIMGKA